MAPESHSQESHPLTSMDVFPPTVVDHDRIGAVTVDLLLLDDGTGEDPRFIRAYSDGRDMKPMNV